MIKDGSCAITGVGIFCRLAALIVEGCSIVSKARLFILLTASWDWTRAGPFSTHV
uniref:Candidate secreted effector n=1 Tax=Meloidogyne incognita TaxID=6306 RepID=A0A914NRI7_MELIC